MTQRMLAAILLATLADAVAVEPTPPSTVVPGTERRVELASATDETFDGEVLRSKLPVLVYFDAEWAGPSRMLRPTIHQLAADYEGRLKVLRVDVDAAPTIAMARKVASVPTLLLFTHGTERARLIGARPKPEIVREIEKLL